MYFLLDTTRYCGLLTYVVLSLLLSFCFFFLFLLLPSSYPEVRVYCLKNITGFHRPAELPCSLSRNYTVDQYWDIHFICIHLAAQERRRTCQPNKASLCRRRRSWVCFPCLAGRPKECLGGRLLSLGKGDIRAEKACMNRRRCRLGTIHLGI